MLLYFPYLELAFSLGMYFKHKAVSRGNVKSNSRDNTCVGTVKTFCYAEKGTQDSNAFYCIFIKPIEIGVFFFRNVFPVKISKICNYFDFFRLKT